MHDDKAFQGRIQRVETLIQSLERISDPAIRADAEELVQTILELHGVGLEQMLDITWEHGAAGQTIIDTLGQDELVGSLLLLHGLHPLPLETRVIQALDKVRPYLKSHGGGVELLDVTDGVVRLRLEGSCQGCPSSRVTLKFAIEEAIHKAAPDVVAIVPDGPTEPMPALTGGFVPITQLHDSLHPNGGMWINVDNLHSLTEGTVRTLEVSGLPVLFCRVGESLYAYGTACANCHQPLGHATLGGRELTCAGCGHRFDVMRAGRDIDAPRLHLEPFPLLVEKGQARVAVPVMG